MFDPRPEPDNIFDTPLPHPLHDTEVRFPSDEQLNDETYLWDIARRLGDLPLARRDIPDWIAEGFYSFPGKIFDQDGQAVNLEDDEVDSAFANEGTFRWLSDFIRMDFLDPKLRKQRVQSRVMKRLRLISAALEIEKLSPRFTEEELNSQYKLRWYDRKPSTLDRPRPLPPRNGSHIGAMLHVNDVANLTEIVNTGIARGITAKMQDFKYRLIFEHWKFMQQFGY
jgi:hypothetical protein